MALPSRIEFEFRGLRLVALGVEFVRYREKPNEATWDLIYIMSDAGKNDITPLLTFTSQDAITDILVNHFEELYGSH
jgi:hypothetical protein